MPLPSLEPVAVLRLPAPTPPQGFEQPVRRKPWHVAGSGRFCTEIMRLLGLRALVKTGAEGVFCAALPELGFGIAIKCDDGAGRAAEAIMAALIARFVRLNDAEHAVLASFARPTLRNWNGIEVGSLRVSDAIAAALPR